MKLQKSKVAEDGTVLMESNPFEPFIGDCDHCKHFLTSPLQHPSGNCTLHAFGCGYGYTCKSFAFSNYMIDKFQATVK